MIAAIYTWVATAIALTGTVLNCKQVRACFYLWTVTNSMWLAWDIYNDLWSRAFLDLVQLGLAIWGIYEWKRLEAKRRAATDDGPCGTERLED